jgi:biotin carboxyl carrier protein
VHYIVELEDGETWDIDIDPEDSSKVIVDGKERRVELNQKPDGSLRAKSEGHVHDVSIRWIDGAFVVETADGRIRKAKVELAETRKFRETLGTKPSPAVIERSGELPAPIAGNVVALLVAPGAKVERGQPILIIDAMKMQNYIASPKDGNVSYHVAVGQTVRAGTPLATVEAKEKLS